MNTLGPTWGVDENEKELFLKAVLTSLSMAEEMMCSSISLPFISSDIYAQTHADYISSVKMLCDGNCFKLYLKNNKYTKLE